MVPLRLFPTIDVLKRVKPSNLDSLKALQLALDNINRRINNLLELKISANNVDGSLLSDEEFAERKQAFLQEKAKVTDQLNKQSGNEGEWVEVARDSFNFALEASEKYKQGSPEDKKTIVKTVGSNLILLYQKLEFQPRYLFLKYMV